MLALPLGEVSEREIESTILRMLLVCTKLCEGGPLNTLPPSSPSDSLETGGDGDAEQPILRTRVSFSPA